MPDQGLPITPLQAALNAVFAATPAIWDVLAGDKVFDGLVPPMVDANTVRPMPYFAWANPTDVPHSDSSSSFGELGSAATLRLHIFDNHRFSKARVMALADAVKRKVSGKVIDLGAGYRMLTSTVDLIDCSPVPTGFQGILAIAATVRTVNNP